MSIVETVLHRHKLRQERQTALGRVLFVPMNRELSPSPPRDWSLPTSRSAGYRRWSKRLQTQGQIAASLGSRLGGNFVSSGRNEAGRLRSCVFPAIFCKVQTSDGVRRRDLWHMASPREERAGERRPSFHSWPLAVHWQRHGLEHRNYPTRRSLPAKHAPPDAAWMASGGLGCYKHATPAELLCPGPNPPETARNQIPPLCCQPQATRRVNGPYILTNL